MLRVNCETQIFEDLGLGERSLLTLGTGDFETDLRDRLYLSLEREREVLLPDDEDTLGLRPVGVDFPRLCNGEGLLLAALTFTYCIDFFSLDLVLPTLLAELEALLLREEVPVEDTEELAELEREPERLVLPSLLRDEELRQNHA